MELFTILYDCLHFIGLFTCMQLCTNANMFLYVYIDIYVKSILFLLLVIILY